MKCARFWKGGGGMAYEYVFWGILEKDILLNFAKLNWHFDIFSNNGTLAKDTD